MIVAPTHENTLAFSLRQGTSSLVNTLAFGMGADKLARHLVLYVYQHCTSVFLRNFPRQQEKPAPMCRMFFGRHASYYCTAHSKPPSDPLLPPFLPAFAAALAQAHVLGCVRGVQHFGGVLVDASPLDPLLLRPQAGFPRVVLPAPDSGSFGSGLPVERGLALLLNGRTPRGAWKSTAVGVSGERFFFFFL